MTENHSIPGRLLLVEDDPAIRVLFTVVLGRENVFVESVPDGADALGRVRRTPYDALIVDLLLPRLNGFELLREIAVVAPHLLRRTIVATAASDHTLRDFDARPFAKLLRKPVDLHELVRTVHDCMNRARVDHAAARLQ